MVVQWRGNEVFALVKGAGVQSIVRGVEAVKDETVRLVNTGPKTGRVYRRNGVVHQASAPGQAPAGDTGDLASKIGTAVDADKMTGTVEFYSAHAKMLEYGTQRMSPRPFARVALADKSEEIAKDIAESIGRVLK
ncbi:hypothetical protein EN788_22220 [Mesorhizobium sp. M2D.F.Ca.ET.145.01.1.1]|uniref:HK97-gp10 family putative phage morphogenesis protein n=1 Tax=unclassified Mesorhizobium TaxID=325217 RepID=UPI000FCA7367|nr:MULTISPECIES: HK97-gp10 family putative phage morphogenesis protein [unclassified Mesorhizobium]TGU44635.1 hypothetical protein EN789_21770 [bacterium M00.F.Ca.ET.146.01.1.1]TGU58463.1 hypothetical protein EN791_021770 [Mesorhizobium sp. M2D.F.Ca.ET.148.01.1.1]TGU64395.1 hypothetical protein EN790_21765 [Mesorhizobium sp. M2D.F.Ca.ET.147.01.1.1]TGW09971.1 hypothetical protein EN788_22220 [Mesorhizobium sp. M2D.F.Ca.ET.145.01.1.1]